MAGWTNIQVTEPVDGYTEHQFILNHVQIRFMSTLYLSLQPIGISSGSIKLQFYHLQLYNWLQQKFAQGMWR